MPLIQSRSKKAFKKNVEAEMEAGKPQDQSLAISYAIKKKNSKKKMAAGGRVDMPPRDDADHSSEESKDMAKGRSHSDANGRDMQASSEKRPMPEDKHMDSEEVSRNSGKKAIKKSGWTDDTWSEQAGRSFSVKLSQPKIAGGSDGFSVRARNMHDEEADLMGEDRPDGYGKRPRAQDDAEPHPSHLGGEKNPTRRGYAKGGPVMEPEDHGMEKMERDDEVDLQRSAAPASPNEQPKHGYDEEKHPGSAPNPDEAPPHTGESEQDMLRRHAMERASFYQGGYAEGGKASKDDSPQEIPRKDAKQFEKGAQQSGFNPSAWKENIKHAFDKYADGGEVGNPKLQQAHKKMDRQPQSIAKMIMRRKQMAEGGVVEDDDLNLIYKNPKQEGEADVEWNAREHQNLEDQLSYEALRKENYSEQAALDESDHPWDSNEHGNSPDPRDEPDQHDMVGQIRKKIKYKRQIG